MKKRYFILLAVLIVIIQVIFVVYSYNQDNDIELSNDYVAVFKGESGERVNSTYVFVKKKGRGKKKKYTYKYINTVSTMEGYDSTIWNEKITKKGTLKKKKKIYDIAKKNNAYSYVKYEDGNIYSIGEFKKMFK
jgi:hypothetical protein